MQRRVIEQKIVLSLEAGTTRYWELTFAPDGALSTSVTISQANTGGRFPAEKAAQAARSCAAR